MRTNASAGYEPQLTQVIRLLQTRPQEPDQGTGRIEGVEVGGVLERQLPLAAPLVAARPERVADQPARHGDRLRRGAAEAERLVLGVRERVVERLGERGDV